MIQHTATRNGKNPWRCFSKNLLSSIPARPVRVPLTTECQHDLTEFLRAGLVSEPDVTRSLRQFARQRRNTGKDWLTIIEAFAESQGLGEGILANTYDHANLLRPGARYLQFDSLVILQPHHGGTDARTGYGEPCRDRRRRLNTCDRDR
jgi:hypothetical protein